MITFTPSRCHINLAALERNFQRLGPGEKLMPVIKSDAYGHGLLPVAATLAQNGARWFAVGTASEGAGLRKRGFNQNIVLLLGCLTREDWQLTIKNKLIPIVGTVAELDQAYSMLANSGEKNLHVAIKCDTGMSRLGFTLEELPQLLEKLKRYPELVPQILISHFACADMPEENAFTEHQRLIFNEFYNCLKTDFPAILRSIGNSAATLSPRDYDFDICRPGFVLYGGNPFAGTPLAAHGQALEWVMSVSAPVVHVRDLVKGQSVSYGRMFTAPRPMKIAVIASGYATGLDRGISGRTHMLINGKRVPQIGRICMGMCMVDITGNADVKAGDLAWIVGGIPDPGQVAVTAEEIAALSGTIPYETLCLLGTLNPRVYERDGMVMETEIFGSI